MNKLIKLSLISFLALTIFACEDAEEVIYNGQAAENRTFLSFPSSTFSLPVNVDSSASLEILLNSSTMSDVDRTYSLSLNTEEEATTANPMTYALPSTVVIPANSYQGSFIIEGMDNGLLDSSIKTIAFSLSGLGDTEDIDENNLVVNIFEVCPVDAGLFLGDYTITNLSGPGVLGCPIFPENGVVTLELGASELARTFVAEYVLDCGFGSFPTQFSFTLVCNEIVFDFVDTGLTCDQGTPTTLTVQQGDVAGAYDATNDNSFTLQVTDNVDSDCGGGPTQTSYTFTKL